MPLPYYSKKIDPFLSPEAPVLLSLSDLIKEIGHLIKMDLRIIPISSLRYITDSFEWTRHLSHHSNGLAIWKEIVEAYFALMQYGLDVGKEKEMFEIYMTLMKRTQEGYQDFMHSDDIIESLKDKDVEVKFNALMQHYHILHESIIRYSFSVGSFCADLLSSHPDINKTPITKYCEDAVSYKKKKLESCPAFIILLLGVEPHLRNAISHKNIEYDLHGKSVTFLDKDPHSFKIVWSKVYAISEFEKLIEALELNARAQLSALNLFFYNNKVIFEKFDVPAYQNMKELNSLIYQELLDAALIAKDIKIENDEIICEVELNPQYQRPSATMGNINGVRFYKDIPAYKPDEQALRAIQNIAAINTPYKLCTINIDKYLGKHKGTIVVNLGEWTKLIQTDLASKENLDKYIIKNTFKV